LSELELLKIELEVISSGKKEEAPIIQVRLLKRRRRKVKVDPKLGG
jgi:ASC-1-like (ASCH) protein